MSPSSDLYFAQTLVGDMQNLAYLIGSRAQRKALVVDPAWNVQGLLDQAARDDVEIVGALVTHYHQDHVGGEIFGHRIEGLGRLLELAPMPIHVNKHEAEGLKKVTGVSDSDLVAHEGGDVIELGAIHVRLIHTPGHTPGSQCFLVEERDRAGQLVSGDTLFLDGCGRVDLPGADPRAMYESLETLKALPDDTTLFPGHLYSPEGHDSMGAQKRTNPYLRAANVDMFLGFMGY
ncbi:MAG TPA: MBL fold metallo-hydrolase [Myxococcota bacterium]|nr:MBL fold metallo-hydrolase [Myxococcales bacterium]HPG24442.1 MBL fold metallo-hydrolase [Myxococcota bacterium]